MVWKHLLCIVCIVDTAEERLLGQSVVSKMLFSQSRCHLDRPPEPEKNLEDRYWKPQH